MDQIFPGVENFEHRHERRGSDGFARSWNKDEADIKVNCACDQCNSGWMDELDHAAEDLFLTVAATGHSARLGKLSDQATVARWCALIAALSDQIQAIPVLSKRVHTAVYGGEMPEGTRIWLMRMHPEPFRVRGWIDPRELNMTPASGTPDRNAFLVTFGVQYLVGQVFIPMESTPGLDLDFDRKGNASVLRQLWPPLLTPFIWPPPETLRADQRDAVAGWLQG